MLRSICCTTRSAPCTFRTKVSALPFVCCSIPLVALNMVYLKSIHVDLFFYNAYSSSSLSLFWCLKTDAIALNLQRLVISSAAEVTHMEGILNSRPRERSSFRKPEEPEEKFFKIEGRQGLHSPTRTVLGACLHFSGQTGLSSWMTNASKLYEYKSVI